MTKEKTIRGDQLLLAFKCIERTYAAFVANPLEDDLPDRIWDALGVGIDHPYGYAHWYAEIAIRTPTRKILEMLMDETTRRVSHLCIDGVAEHATEAVSNSDVFPGLSGDDKKKLIAGLTRFLNLVACGEIDENILRKR